MTKTCCELASASYRRALEFYSSVRPWESSMGQAARHVLASETSGQELLGEMVAMREALEKIREKYSAASIEFEEETICNEALSLPHTQRMAAYVSALEKVSEAAKQYRSAFDENHQATLMQGKLFECIEAFKKAEEALNG